MKLPDTHRTLLNALLDQWLAETPCRDGRRHVWRGYSITTGEEMCTTCGARRAAAVKIQQ